MIPFEKQRLFIETPHREALYGMHPSGGKTTALVWGALQGIEDPNHTALLVRAKLGNLLQPAGLIEVLERLTHGHKAYTTALCHGRHRWTFESGATVVIDHAPNLQTVQQRNGAKEYRFVGIDEAGELAPPLVEFLGTRARGPNGGKLRLATNAGQRHEAWLTERFAGEHTYRLFIPSVIGP